MINPPLPEGFTEDLPSTTAPAPPAGFTIDTPPPAERGLIGETVAGVKRGGLQLLDMAGNIARAVDPEGGVDVVRDAGLGISKFAKDRSVQPDVAETTYGETHPILGNIPKAAEMIIPSVGVPLALGLGAAAAGAAAPVATGVGVVGSGLAFGLSQFQDTKERGLEAGLTEEQATTAGIKTGLSVGGLEAASSIIPAAKIFKLGKPVTGSVVKSLFKAPSTKAAAKTLVNDASQIMAGEVSTEMAQAYTQGLTEKNAGIRPDADPIQEAKDVIGPTIALSLMLGGVVGGANKLSKMATQRALQNAGVGEDVRRQAAANVHAALLSEEEAGHVPAGSAENWMANTEAAISAKAPLVLSDELLQAAERKVSVEVSQEEAATNILDKLSAGISPSDAVEQHNAEVAEQVETLKTARDVEDAIEVAKAVPAPVSDSTLADAFGLPETTPVQTEPVVAAVPEADLTSYTPDQAAGIAAQAETGKITVPKSGPLPWMQDWALDNDYTITREGSTPSKGSEATREWVIKKNEAPAAASQEAPIESVAPVETVEAPLRTEAPAVETTPKPAAQTSSKHVPPTAGQFRQFTVSATEAGAPEVIALERADGKVGFVTPKGEVLATASVGSKGQLSVDIEQGIDPYEVQGYLDAYRKALADGTAEEFTPSEGYRNVASQFGEDISFSAAEPRAPKIPTTQNLRKAMAAFYKTTEDSFNFELIAATGEHAAADAIAKEFGKRVYVIDTKGDRRLGNAFVIQPFDNAIFIAKDAEKPAVALLGHETVHLLRRDAPGLYTELVGHVLSGAEKKRFHKYLAWLKTASPVYADLNHDKIVEEYVGNVVGNQFTRQPFWQELAKTNPSLFAKVLSYVRDLVEKAKTALSKEKFAAAAATQRDMKQLDVVTAAIFSKYSRLYAAGKFDVDVAAKVHEAKLAARTEAPVLKSAASMFDEKAFGNLRTPVLKSREKLIEMPIKDFLALAEPTRGSTDKQTRVSKLVEAGTKFNDLPYLLTDTKDGSSKAVGHEGRHRAEALRELGYETMPIVIRDRTIRWDQQVDPEKFDYIEKWPTELQAETGSKSLPFPVPREDAGKPYVDTTAEPVAAKTRPFATLKVGPNLWSIVNPDGKTATGQYTTEAAARSAVAMRNKLVSRHKSLTETFRSAEASMKKKIAVSGAEQGKKAAASVWADYKTEAEKAGQMEIQFAARISDLQNPVQDITEWFKALPAKRMLNDALTAAYRWLMPVDKVVTMAASQSDYLPIQANLKRFLAQRKEMAGYKTSSMIDGHHVTNRIGKAFKSNADLKKLENLVWKATTYELHADPARHNDWTEESWAAAEMPALTGKSLTGALQEVHSLYAQFTPEQKTAHQTMLDQVNTMYLEGRSSRLKVLETGYADKVAQAEAFLRSGVEEVPQDLIDVVPLVKAIYDQYPMLKGDYMPLMRFGEHAVRTYETDENGELGERVRTEFFTSKQDAQDYVNKINQNPRNGLHAKVEVRPDMRRDVVNIPLALIDKFRAAAEARGFSGEALETMVQDLAGLRVTMLPRTSTAAGKLHRENVEGYSQDVLKVFATYVRNHAIANANMIHGSKIEQTFRDMRNNIDAHDSDPSNPADPNAVQNMYNLMNNLYALEKAGNQEKINEFTKAMNKATFVWFLASPSVWAVQWSQPFMTTIPKMASRFGFGTAFKAYTSAAKQYMSGKFSDEKIDTFDREHGYVGQKMYDLIDSSRDATPAEKVRIDRELKAIYDGFTSQDDKRLLILKVLSHQGALDLSSSHSIQDLAAGTSEGELFLDKVVNKSGIFMQKSETGSRRAGAVSAFELAMAEGKGFIYANDYTSDIINDTLFNFDSQNRGPAWRGNTGRILGQFQFFRFHMVGKLVQLTKDAMGGEYNRMIQDAAGDQVKIAEADKMKAEARKELAYVVGSSFALAGAAGTPLALAFGNTASEALWDALELLFGDDDDPLDLKREFELAVRDSLGDVAGNVVLKGLPSLLGADISRRIGMGGLADIIQGDPPAGATGTAKANWYAGRILGPTWGIMTDAMRASDALAEGEFSKALQYSSPKLLKDFMKALDVSDSGVKAGGKTILQAEDVNMWSYALMLSGINPMEIALAQEENRYIKNLSTSLSQKRSRLVQDMAEATVRSDSDAQTAAAERINNWAIAQPKLKITSEELVRGIKKIRDGEAGKLSKREMLIKGSE